MLRRKTKDKKVTSFRNRLPAQLKRKKLQPQTLASILPNIMTTLAMCAGMTAVRMAMMGRFEVAVAAIIIAAILDAMDGRVARLLNSTSRMGAELDSLSDLLNFGAAPGIVIYLRALQHWGEAGWAIVLFYMACVAFRLARFNILSKEETPVWAKGYFVGVPSTAGGLLALWPITVEKALGIEMPVLLYAFIFILVGILMVSRLKTFSMKNITIPHRYVLPLMLIVVLTIGAVYSYPWIVFSLIGLIYLIHIPFSVRYYKLALNAQNTTEEKPS